MIPKIYLDEDISPLLAELLKKEGVDAISALEVGVLGESDDVQLDYACQEGRVLVTFNVGDFHQRAGLKKHSGIILCKQVSLGEYSVLLEKILDKLTLIDDWSSLLVWAG